MFKDFAVNDLGLNDRESKALTVSSVNLLPMSEDILNFGVSDYTIILLLIHPWKFGHLSGTP